MPLPLGLPWGTPWIGERLVASDRRLGWRGSGRFFLDLRARGGLGEPATGLRGRVLLRRRGEGEGDLRELRRRGGEGVLVLRARPGEGERLRRARGPEE